MEDFTREHPSIRVVFDPTPAPEYDEVLQAQLEGGTAPDVFYLRSYGVSRKLFDQGFLEPLNDLPEIMANFSAETLEPWAWEGVVYGLPMIATSHGIYYNQDLFEKLGLEVPQDWEALLAAAEQVKEAGIIPFANASGDSWTINEIVFYNILPNFIGGRQGRNEYLKGERCFNDAGMVSGFKALADLRPYLPPNQALLTYKDSLQLFIQGKAAMWLGGSWDIPFFEDNNPSFKWSAFAPPPPKGRSPHITFHLDAGLGLNAASGKKEAARKLLRWMAQPAFGELMGNQLPGFFPMHRTRPTLDNEHAETFLALNTERGADVRFVWDKLRDGEPSGYELTEKAALAVLNGEMEPQQAADFLQEGLMKWFEPACRCRR